MRAALDIAASASLIEEELRRELGAKTLPLYDMLRHHLGWGAESDDAYGGAVRGGRSRLLGVACLAACQANGGGVESCLPAAASLEALQAFLEIHDDVQAGNPQRGGRDAVWWKWGPAQAINAGDAMYAVARIGMMRLAERGASPETVSQALRVFDRTSLTLCEGRYLEMEAQERIDLDVDSYLKMAEDKSGASYAGAMSIGAIVANAGDAATGRLEEFGRGVGVARQIWDDVHELWGRSEPSFEVLNKKKLLPIVYAVQNSDISVKRRLGEIFFKRTLDVRDFEIVRDIVEERGGREYAELAADARSNAAIDCMRASDLPPASKDDLENLAKLILSH